MNAFTPVTPSTETPWADEGASKGYRSVLEGLDEEAPKRAEGLDEGASKGLQKDFDEGASKGSEGLR